MRRRSLFVLCAWALAQATAGAQGQPPGRIPADVAERLRGGERVRVVVQLAEPSTPAADRDGRLRAVRQSQDQLLAQLGVTGTPRRLQHLPIVALEIDAGMIGLLESQPDVVSVRADELRRPTLIQSVPLIGAPSAWSEGGGGAGWTVAILDTGVDKAHPFLAGKVVAEACFSSTTSFTTSLCPGGVDGPGVNTGLACASSISGCEHGTHVAGIAAGGAAGYGFSGVGRDASIAAVQVFSRVNDSSFCGTATPCTGAFDSDVLAALDYVYGVRAKLDVSSVNLSLGGGAFASSCDATLPAYKAAIDLLRGAGIATVIAAGNNGFTSRISAPACISSAVSVGATTKSDQIAAYSNRSPQLSLLAPGSSIYSSVPGGGFATLSGTSMAAPHVAGAWAVMKSRNPGASVSTVLSTLVTTGLSIYDAGSGAWRRRIRLDTAVHQLAPGPIVVTAFGADVAFPQPANATITWTARAVGGPGPIEYRFLLYSSQSASWSVLRNYGTAPSAAWTPTTPGTFSLQVWARHVGSNASFEAWRAAGPVTISVEPVSVTSVVADRQSPLFAGVATTWTALGKGGSGPLEYKFLRYHQNDATWTVVRDYAPSNTWSWTPDVLDSGTYRLQVWARTIGSGAAFEGWANSALFSLLGTSNFLLNSQPGDYIGLGQYTLRGAEGASMTLQANYDNGVSVSWTHFDTPPMSWWYFDFAPRQGEALVPGVYEGAIRFPFQEPTQPGLSVSGDGRGCNQLTGRFVILENADAGQPSARFAADFEQHCEGMTPALFGSVRFNSAIPPSERPAKVTLKTTSTFPLATGAPATWTATASGGAAPLRYKFLLYTKATSSWSVAQDGTSPSFTWSSNTPGDYSLQVWVRSNGSAAPYEAWAGAGTFSVTAAPLVVTTLTRTPTSPLTAGTPYTWTAEATGGSAPLEYEFLVYSQQAGSWTIARGYDTSNSFTWTPAAPGTYSLQVWVRSAGSAAAWEAWKGSGWLVVDAP